MRIDGTWHLCDDGMLRPVLQGQVLAADGSWEDVVFLLDTGADQTVFSADTLQKLGLTPQGASEPLTGVGGTAEAIVLATELRLFREAGGDVIFRGQFQAFTDPKALDMSVLGRNLLNLFAVIVDRSQEVICLLAQRHRYVIVEE